MERTYDTNNNQILSVSYTWDTATNSWIESWKYEDAFDANNNNTLSASYSWDTAMNSWIGSWKNEYTYDSNNNQTLSASYQWDTLINNFVLVSSCNTSYDPILLCANAFPVGFNGFDLPYDASHAEFITMYGYGPLYNAINLPVYNTCSYYDSTTFHYSNITNTSIEDGLVDSFEQKKLLKVTDILGQETPYRRNTPLLYIYNDGTVEKRIVVE